VTNGIAPRIKASLVPLPMNTSFFKARPLYQKEKKGDRLFFLGTVPFSLYNKKERDCPSSQRNYAFIL
jgi:hypothetical protein